MKAIYRLKNLTKRYEGRCVLEVKTLDIFRGEIFAIVGPSGSGKSTLLRILNFLEPPSSGSVLFRGIEFGDGKEMPLEMRRRVTTVFQRPMLLNRNVWENVTFGLKLRGERKFLEIANTALEEVGLVEFTWQRARALSGGEAQRVALARAIVLRPDVLLLDEPTANLDPYNVGVIENVVQDLNQERGTTIVLVTRKFFQAKRFSHRVAFLLEGKIIEVASVEDFFESPRDSRTAAFVRGDMVY